MPVNVTNFASQIALWANKTKRNMTNYVRQTCNELAEEIITTAPCDTGAYIGNWNPTLNAPVISDDFIPGPSKYGKPPASPAETAANRARATAHVRSKLAAVIPTMQQDDTFYLSNGVRHVRYVEYGGGNTPPYAIVRRAIHKIRRKVEQSATFGSGSWSNVKRGALFE